jgi:hypothetical protein
VSARAPRTKSPQSESPALPESVFFAPTWSTSPSLGLPRPALHFIPQAGATSESAPLQQIATTERDLRLPPHAAVIVSRPLRIQLTGVAALILALIVLSQASQHV